MTSVRPMAGGESRAVYMVRNTFIELEPSPEEEVLDSARAFQTWPLASPSTPEASAKPHETEVPAQVGVPSPEVRLPARRVHEDLEDGEVPEDEDEADSAVAAAPAVARELGELPEEGELIDSEDGELSSCEDGELLEDGELPPNVAGCKEPAPTDLATPTRGAHAAAVSLGNNVLEDGRPAQLGSIFMTTPTQNGNPFVTTPTQDGATLPNLFVTTPTLDSAAFPNPFVTTPTKDCAILPDPFVTTPTKELESVLSTFVTSPPKESWELSPPGLESSPLLASPSVSAAIRALGLPPGEIPPGSRGHAAGLCKPCAWMHKTAAGCRNAAKCEYCHLCPPGELKQRKKDKMQARMGAAVAQRGRQPPRPAPEDASFGGATAEGSGHGGFVSSDALTLSRVSDMEPCYVAVPGAMLPPTPSHAQAAGGPPQKMSLGSMAHGTGNCKPCAWAHKDAAGCRNGSHCSYCHLCPPGELKRRKREKWERLQSTLTETTNATAVAPGLALL